MRSGKKRMEVEQRGRKGMKEEEREKRNKYK
jgi:hypothetical protein